MRIGEILEALQRDGRSNVSSRTLRRCLGHLVTRGKLVRLKPGLFTLPDGEIQFVQDSADSELGVFEIPSGSVGQVVENRRGDSSASSEG
jgi:hypothetical protein